MTALATIEGRAVAAPATFSLAPRTLDEAFRLAEMLADSELVPKDFRGKPGNVLIAMQWGFEVGMQPLQALQNIAVINGRPSMWGDALLALVRASPLCEYVLESADAGGTAICRVKRRGEPEQIRTFSDADAKTAGLIGKQGPWQNSPKRMKQMRARAFALRDVFTDVLKGMQAAEELLDMPQSDPPPLQDAEQVVPGANVADWIEKVRATTTDEAAAAMWAEGSKAIATARDKHGYVAFKDAVVQHRKALKEATDAARTVEAPAPPSPAVQQAETDAFVAEMHAAEGAQP